MLKNPPAGLVYLVCSVYLVCLVCLVCLDYLIELDQPDEQNKAGTPLLSVSRACSPSGGAL